MLLLLISSAQCPHIEHIRHTKITGAEPAIYALFEHSYVNILYRLLGVKRLEPICSGGRQQGAAAAGGGRQRGVGNRQREAVSRQPLSTRWLLSLPAASCIIS